MFRGAGPLILQGVHGRGGRSEYRKNGTSVPPPWATMLSLSGKARRCQTNPRRSARHSLGGRPPFRESKATVHKSKMPYASKERQRAACRQHYLDHKPAYIDRARAHTKGMQVQIAAFLAAHLEDHPCVDCGEADPIVLEFDHRARSDKRFNVSDMRYGRTSLATVKAEVAKCDVRCANCHRRKTYRERQDADGTLGRPEPSVLSLFGSMPG